MYISVQMRYLVFLFNFIQPFQKLQANLIHIFFPFYLLSSLGNCMDLALNWAPSLHQLIRVLSQSVESKSNKGWKFQVVGGTQAEKNKSKNTFKNIKSSL